MSGFRAKDGELLGQGRVLLPFPGQSRADVLRQEAQADEDLGERVSHALGIVQSASDILDEMMRRNRALEAEAARRVAYHRERAESATRDVSDLRANYDRLAAANAKLVADFECRRLAYEERIRRQDDDLRRLKQEVTALNEMIGGFNRQVESLLGKAPRVLADCANIDDLFPTDKL